MGTQGVRHSLDYLCPKKHSSKISWNSLRACKKFYCQKYKLESFATKEHPSYNKLLTDRQRENNKNMASKIII